MALASGRQPRRAQFSSHRDRASKLTKRLREPNHHRSHAVVGIEWASFRTSSRKSNEKADLASRSNYFAGPRVANPRFRVRTCGGRIFFAASSAAGGKESSEDDRDQRAHADRQLLLAAGQKES